MLCIVPTLATAAWIVDRRLPSHGRSQAERLGSLLQVQAKIDGFREPRPQWALGSLLTLSDPSTHRTLAMLEAPRLHVGRGVYSVVANRLAINLEEMGAIAQKVSCWLASPRFSACELYIDRLAIKLQPTDANNPREIVLGAVQVECSRNASGVARMRVAIRAPGSSPEQKPYLQLVVERPTPGADAQTVVFMENSAPIPAAMVAGVPGLSDLDHEAAFIGSVQWSFTPSGLAGVAKGRLENVDISFLLPVGSPHAATGRAAVVLNELKWRDRRLDRIDGTLSAESAELSRSLLAAAVKHLYCVQVGDGVAAPDSPSMIAVDRLACRFLLDPKGLTLTGDMPPAAKLPSGCLAASGGACLLTQPQYVEAPAGAWVQFVSGPASSWLPASAGAVRLAERLPLPE